VASCLFYGTWDWRFLFLMFTSISVDYFCAIRIGQSDDEKVRKRFLVLSIVVNLSILGFFKYFNFFTDSLQTFIHYLRFPFHVRFLNIILPLGISFYTFEAMSYVIDVYKRKVEPTKHYLDYALFVTYFPHLIAGPIMRAKDLLPQIAFPRTLSLTKFYEGCYLIFWGLFQKIFVADNLAKVVDPVFTSGESYHGAKIVLALYAFAFQIYCDFDGYSNIARGLGKCMGFDIMVNFNLPYLSTNPREFWQRWHISLSSWLRDYLYIPLGGNQRSGLITFRNIIITFLLGGLWHGANWTFVLFGAYHGLLLILYQSLLPLLKKLSVPRAIKIIFFFHFICFGWLIFRAQSASQLLELLKALILNFQFVADAGLKQMASKIIFFTWVVVLVNLLQFKRNDLITVFRLNWATKVIFYLTCFYLILIFGVSGAKEFIYFRF